MKDSLKVRGSLAGAILLVVLGSVASFWTFGEMTRCAAARQHTTEVIHRAGELLSDVKDMETGMRGFLLTGNEDFLEPYTQARGDLRTQLKELTQAVSIAEGRSHIEAISPLLDAKLAHVSQAVELKRKQDSAAAIATVSGGTGKRLMDSIRSELNAFMILQEESLKQREIEYRASGRMLFSIIVIVSLCTLVWAFAFGYFIYRESRFRLKSRVHLETQHLLEAQEHTNAQLLKANHTLQESEEKLGVTFNSIGDAVLVTDSGGRITALNPVAEQLTGWSRADALGQPVAEVFQIIHKDTREPALIPVADALEHGTVQGLANHTVLISRDGSEYDIGDSCAPIRDRDHQIVGAVLVFRDVTKEYAVQQSLRDSSAFVQTILNTVVDGIITVHASGGGIETVNPATERMFGFSTAELRGQNLSLLIPGLEGDLQADLLQTSSADAHKSSRGPGREVSGRRKDGSVFPLEIVTCEMSLGGQSYYTGILRDLTARKEVEEALVKAGALQNAIFNSANFSSIATDAKGVIQIFNVGAERMLGYTAADVVDRISPADISDPQEVIARASALSVELGTPITPGFEALVFKASREIEDIYELTYIRKDGSRFPAVVSVTALRNDQNAIIGYLLIGTDNTARKQAEEALLQAGALQNAIFNSANFSSIATDAAGVIQIFNVGAERMLGYTAEDVMNKVTPAEISDPQEVIARAAALSLELGVTIAPGFEALVFKASRGIEDIYELTYIRKDGSRFPAMVSVTALRDAHGTIIGYLLIGTDNTARQQVEEERTKLDQSLRDQQFYTRSLIESNIDALMTTDPGGIITDVNNQMESLTGCSREELIGAYFKNYFTDPARAEAGIKKVLRESKVTDYELTARAKDGQETVVSYNAATLHDRDGVLQGVFAAARDVTERKRWDKVLQENTLELETAKAIAEKANLAKSDFLSSMSHELRSPLNAILGFAQLMDSDSPPPTVSQKGSIDQILHAGWYLLELINEILDLAVVESGRLSLSLEPVSLPDVLVECQSMIEPQALKRGIRMTFPQFDEPCFIRADHTRVKQVIINLLSNAIKYNQPGGTVVVDCVLTVPGRVRICVKDTGAGLSPENLAQLFQPFNRLGQEAGGEEGTGIGLVVSKRLVELMEGKIGVESRVGEGSVFWIDLTADADPHAEYIKAAFAKTDGLPIPAGPRSRLLLYVEDNPANL